MKKQLRIGKQCGFIAALVMLAVSGVNAQKIVLGIAQPVYGPIDNGGDGSQDHVTPFFHSINTQCPHPTLGGFFIDCPFLTLRHYQGGTPDGTMDVYASNYLGIDIFQRRNILFPLGEKSPGTDLLNPSQQPKNIPDDGLFPFSPANSDGDLVWQYRQDIRNFTLPQYRATNVVWLRKAPYVFPQTNGGVLFNDPQESPRPGLVPPPSPVPNDGRGWSCDGAFITHVYKIESRDIPNPNPYGIAAGDLIGFVHVETWNFTQAPYPVEVYSIGIAYAKVQTNGGYAHYPNWVYCGDIIRERTNSSTGTSNITGVPYIDKRDLSVPDASGDTFYVYFNDYDQNGWFNPYPNYAGKKACVARANKRTVITNAAQIFYNMANYHMPVTLDYNFRKLLATGWDATNAVDSWASARDLFPMGNRPNPLPDMHSSAVWCAPLGRYLMTVSSGVEGPPAKYAPNEANGEIRLYSSVDGINWGIPIMVGNTPAGSNILDNGTTPVYYPFAEKVHSFFVSLDLDASDDSHIVGKHFYIYWARSYRDGRQELMRCEVNIKLPSFNGDNMSDLMIFKPSDNSIQMLTSNGSGFNTQSQWATGFGGSKDDYFPADFNGDGITELGYYNRSDNSFKVSISSTGAPPFGPQQEWLPGNKTYNGVLFGIPVVGQTGKFYVGDFNGDGKADLMYFNPSDHSIWVSTANAAGNYLDGPGSGLWSGPDWFGSRQDNYFAADFNGDGKTDICYHESNNIFYVLLSSGTSFDWTISGTGLWLDANVLGGYNCSYYTGDFNGDGKADLLCVDPAPLNGNGNRITVGISTGTWISSPGTGGFNGPGPREWCATGNFGTKGDYFFPADFNGDGKTDLGYVRAETDYTFWVNLSSGTTFNNWITGSGQWGTAPGSIDNQYYVSNSLNKKTATYLVRSSQSAYGTISPFGVVTTSLGTARTFTITPSAGAAIYSVTVDGINQGAITTYTFPSSITGTHSIDAKFSGKLPRSAAGASSGNYAGTAIDGKYDTRWTSNNTDHEWIYVNLGSTKNVYRIKMYWQAAVRQYTIQGSSNGSNYTDLVPITKLCNDPLTHDISVTPGSYRYIRMYGMARCNNSPYSLNEFEIYGN